MIGESIEEIIKDHSWAANWKPFRW